MSTTQQPVPPAPAQAPRRRSAGWTAVGVVGELLVTLGVLILLFVAWQLWWTDVLADRSYADQRETLQQSWQTSTATTTPTDRADATVATIPGRAFALMYIPALRDSAWALPVLSGTDQETLQRGVGHHIDTALPGEPGNFAVAGHRTTYGAPFGDIDRLQRGDQVIIETEDAWYTYELDRSEIIDATEGWVLDPVPGEPAGTRPTKELITIYACHPKFSAAERFVWFGHLVAETPRSAGPPAIVTELETAGT